jgi:hypothetical protein
LPIDKRGAVPARVDDTFDDVADWGAFARNDPARTDPTVPVAGFAPAVAALEALEYVPAPPSERTADAPNDGKAITVLNTQIIDNVEIFNSVFITPQLHYPKVYHILRIGTTTFFLKNHFF